MIERPSLVFIHGTAGHKRLKKWLPPLNESLTTANIEPFEEFEIRDVDYESLLSAKKDSPPAREVRPEASKDARRRFERNQSQLSERLAKYRVPKVLPASPQGIPAAPAGWPEKLRRRAAKEGRRAAFRRSAEAYRDRRERVCNQVLDLMGPGDAIVIAHSLGSVVAADLLSRLRPDQHVRLLITVGSPLSFGSWDRTIKRLDPFPYDRVDAWVNIRNRIDWVTGSASLKKRIDQVVDVPIGRFTWKRPPKKLPFAQHRVREYVSHPAVAEAIAWALEQST